MLLTHSAPHRAEHLLVAVKHTLKVVLASAGRTEAQAAEASENNAQNGLALVQAKVENYLAAGTPAEEAYDLALADLGDWARQLP